MARKSLPERDEMAEAKDAAIREQEEATIGLLHCAHCGDEPEATPRKESPRPASLPFQLRCRRCHCGTPWTPLLSVARTLWNARPTRKPAKRVGVQ